MATAMSADDELRALWNERSRDGSLSYSQMILLALRNSDCLLEEVNTRALTYEDIYQFASANFNFVDKFIFSILHTLRTVPIFALYCPLGTQSEDRQSTPSNSRRVQETWTIAPGLVKTMESIETMDVQNCGEFFLNPESTANILSGRHGWRDSKEGALPPSRAYIWMNFGLPEFRRTEMSSIVLSLIRDLRRHFDRCPYELATKQVKEVRAMLTLMNGVLNAREGSAPPPVQVGNSTRESSKKVKVFTVRKSRDPRGSTQFELDSSTPIPTPAMSKPAITAKKIEVRAVAMERNKPKQPGKTKEIIVVRKSWGDASKTVNLDGMPILQKANRVQRTKVDCTPSQSIYPGSLNVEKVSKGQKLKVEAPGKIVSTLRKRRAASGPPKLEIANKKIKLLTVKKEPNSASGFVLVPVGHLEEQSEKSAGSSSSTAKSVPAKPRNARKPRKRKEKESEVAVVNLDDLDLNRSHHEFQVKVKEEIPSPEPPRPRLGPVTRSMSTVSLRPVNVQRVGEKKSLKSLLSANEQSNSEAENRSPTVKVEAVDVEFLDHE